MRAGFLGQSICSLGFGIATLQAPRLVMDMPTAEPLGQPPANESTQEPASGMDEKATLSTAPVTNPQRLCV
jgi:hypothetical protein